MQARPRMKSPIVGWMRTSFCCQLYPDTFAMQPHDEAYLIQNFVVV